MSANSGGNPPFPGLTTPTPQNTEIESSDMELESPGNVLPNQNQTIPITRRENVSTKYISNDPVNIVGREQTQIDKNVNLNNNVVNQNTTKNYNAVPEKRPAYLYDNVDTGPYLVYVENFQAEFNGKLNAIKIGDIIFKNHPELDKEILNIESVGRNRIRIKFKNAISANRFLKSALLQQYNLRQYIPKFVNHKYGIIKGIDLDLTEEYIGKKIKQFDMHCKFTVETVKRLHYKAVNEEGFKILKPSKTILVEFKSQHLPKYISINHVRVLVVPYEQKVMLCYNCFRYGHLGKQCKSNARCLKCKNNHKSEQCTETVIVPNCFHCNGDHLTSEIKKCPEFARQKAIKKLMCEQNMSYLEASAKMPKTTYASIVSSSSNTNIPNKSVGPQTMNSNILSSSNNTCSPRFTQSQNTQGTQRRFTRMINKTQKRPRLSGMDRDTVETHNNIIEPISIPSTSGGVLQNSIYYSNINAPESQDQNCISLSSESLLKLVITIIDSLKTNQTFEIQESALLSIIQNSLGAING